MPHYMIVINYCTVPLRYKAPFTENQRHFSEQVREEFYGCVMIWPHVFLFAFLTFSSAFTLCFITKGSEVLLLAFGKVAAELVQKL